MLKLWLAAKADNAELAIDSGAVYIWLIIGYITPLGIIEINKNAIEITATINVHGHGQQHT